MTINNPIKAFFASTMIMAAADTAAQDHQHHQHNHANHEKTTQMATQQDQSFDIAGLQKEDNTPLQESEYSGKKQFWFFGFTNCPHICPVDMANMHAALRAVKEENGEAAFNKAIEDNKFYMFSVDPDRDTPQVMNDWINNFGDIFEGITATNLAQEEQLDTVKDTARAVVGGNYQSHKSFVYVIDGENSAILDQQNAFGSGHNVHNDLVEFFSENLGLDAPEQKHQAKHGSNDNTIDHSGMHHH